MERVEEWVDRYLSGEVEAAQFRYAFILAVSQLTEGELTLLCTRIIKGKVSNESPKDDVQ